MGNIINALQSDYSHIQTLFDKIMKDGQREFIPEFEKECEDFIDQVSFYENKVVNMRNSVRKFNHLGFPKIRYEEN